jgi:hypothetical protein
MGPDPEILTPLQELQRWLGRRSYRLTRSLLLRLLGLVYLAAFVGLVDQVLPLLGSHGLTPAARFLAGQRDLGEDVVGLPTLFWIDCSDTTLVACAWIGVLLSVAVIAGYANAPILALLWVIYGSFVRVGQDWFSFGWEIQLLETGFLAILLAPPLDPRPGRSRPPPLAVIFLYRWLVFRIMLGAGLIKWRGDPCWRELTCLDYHFETQPLPNPLSPWLHRAPHALHVAGVLVNHLVELVAPWFVFGPRPARLAAGAAMVIFQLTLIVSGNLAFLNWLTLVPIIACFDDDALRSLLPGRARAWCDDRCRRADEVGGTLAHRGHRIAAGVLAVLVAALSLAVVNNLTAERQAMNRSYDRFDLVNTYGAFGAVSRERYELVIEGTSDAVPDEDADWKAYELPCKPGALGRRPCVLGPYHHRLDWLIWFAAMDDSWEYDEWLVHVVWKLLHDDRGLLSLFDVNPFPDQPPRWIRIRRFRYRFAGSGSSDWWIRDQPSEWLPPVSIDDEGELPPMSEIRWP